MTGEVAGRAETGCALALSFCAAAACLLLLCLAPVPARAQVTPLAAKSIAGSVAGSNQRPPDRDATATPNQGGLGVLGPMGSERAPVPLYEAWYFYLALLFFSITLPAHLFRRRMMLMKGRMGIVLQERSRIARECHDTLMAGFAAISWQLEAAAKLFRDNQQESTPAAQSCDLARSMVAHCQAEARRIIWDLRETEEITSVLSQALTRSLAANHSGRYIETTLEVEGEEVQLAPGCVHHLVCIGQEAVTNAVRHADPSHIAVHLKYEQDALRLCVRDDGRGYQAPNRAAARNGHFGIAVMKERSEKLGGTFRIQPLAGSGTEVTVQVSFNAMRHTVNQGQHVVRWIGI
jgi:signal transduction histidine kinase